MARICMELYIFLYEFIHLMLRVSVVWALEKLFNTTRRFYPYVSLGAISGIRAGPLA